MNHSLEVKCDSPNCYFNFVNAATDPFETANEVLNMAVTEFQYPECCLSVIVEDINNVDCEGLGYCNRLTALDDALAEIGIYDRLAWLCTRDLEYPNSQPFLPVWPVAARN